MLQFCHNEDILYIYIYIYTYQIPLSIWYHRMYLFEIKHCLQVELVLTERILATPVQIPWKLDHNGPPWTKEDQEGPIFSACCCCLWGRCTRSNLLPAPLRRSSPAQDGPLWKPFWWLSSLSSLSSMTNSSDMILRPLSICDHFLDCLVTFPQLCHVLRHVCTFIPDQQQWRLEKRRNQLKSN